MTSKAPQFVLLAEQLDADGRTALAEIQEAFDELNQRVSALQHLMYGRKSERMPPLATEVRRTLNHDEVTKLAARNAEENGRTEVTKADEETARRKIGRRDSEPARKKSRAARKAALPVVQEVREVTAADLPDGMTLDDFELMGYEEVRRVELVRAHLVEVVYRLPKLRSKTEHGLIVQAKSPPAPVKGGLYGASVYAHLLHSRVVVGTPLNRLAKTSAANGVLAPSVAIGLFHRAATLLWPLYLLLVEQVRNASHVYADETSQPYQVPGQDKVGKGWMWVAICDQAIAFQFSTSRSAAAGKKLLGEFFGTLLTDGYSGYDSLILGGTRAACWAHVRRSIFEVRKDWAEADGILQLITQMYLVEAELRANHSPTLEAIRRARHKRTRPLLAALFKKFEALQPEFGPRTPQGQAIAYALNHRAELSVFLEDPVVRLDNNMSERELRGTAICRKTTMFVGPGENGMDYAVAMSAMRTCELHKIDPVAWLVDVLPKLAILLEAASKSMAGDEDGDSEAGHARVLASNRAAFEALLPLAWRNAVRA